MAEVIIKGTPVWMFIIMAVCILLVVTGFVMPPTAIIDGSVLKAVGELMGFGLLVDFVEKLPAIIRSGAKAKIQHGNTTIEVGARKKGLGRCENGLDGLNGSDDNVNEEDHEAD